MMRKKSIAPDPSSPGVQTSVLPVSTYLSRNVQEMNPVGNQLNADCSDEVLLHATANRDSRAFELLYDRHMAVVYNLLVCIVHNESIAEELLQDTFWQVWQKAGQYSGNGAGISWIHQIARHKALDLLRSQKARPIIVTNELEVAAWAIPHRPSAEREFEQHWTCQQVQQALAHIPSEQRVCLELAYFDGLSHQEIAEQTATPLGTIKTRIRIGMKKLQRELLGHGYLDPLPSLRRFAVHEGR
ncbi:MAG: sigma-70 family RNA polymerase sigma factor [Chloroflexi bacterium]|nr:sigma-70 family RNA polymerase sigma factor [Chloroflexota bacterium]